MRAFRTVVVAVILSAMFSPAIGLANTESATAPVPARQIVQTGVTLAGAVASTANALNTQNTQSSESSQYAQREQQSKDVQDFKGGAVYIAAGGATLILVLILLIILL